MKDRDAKEESFIVPNETPESRGCSQKKKKCLFEGSSTRLHPFVVESKALYKPKVISLRMVAFMLA